MMNILSLDLKYEWEPFTVGGEHLTFAQLAERKLFANECSHWGAAVFKWEGPLTRGQLAEHVGKMGILIGETDNLRGRIQQYAAATGSSGEAWRHKSFLLQGDMRLYIFKLLNATLGEENRSAPFESWFFYSPRERRILYKELLAASIGLRRSPFIVLLH